MHQDGEWVSERWKCQARASPYDTQLRILNLEICASSPGKQGGDEGKK